MLDVKIYNASSAAEYAELLKSLHLEPDVYYLPEFLACDARLHAAEFEIFTAVHLKEYVIYPYNKRKLDHPFEAYFDIKSPYGYGGPIASSQEFLDRVEPLFMKHVFDSNIVTEFIRYHGIYNKEIRFSRNIENERNREILILDLQKDGESLMKTEFSATNRNLISKMRKEHFHFEMLEFATHIDAFLEMYYSTMKAAKAAEYYYFPMTYFVELKKQLGHKLQLARVHKEGVDYCYSLFFVSGNTVTYYLSARNVDFPKVSGNNFMLAEMILWACERGYTHFNLGGGRTAAPEDALFRFKCSFTHSRTDFYIGKRVHNPEVYKKIIAYWKEKNGEEVYEKNKHNVQFYRN